MGLCCSKKLKKNPDDEGKIDPMLLPQSIRDDLQKQMKNDHSHQHLTENLVLHEFDRDIHEFYEINNGSILGSGMSGSVKICVDKKTKTRYALKTLNKRNVIEDKLPQLRDEIRIMALLDHPNILRVVECFENTENIYIILELCTGHDLLTCLNRQTHIQYSEKRTCELVSMMLSALRYCHEHGIVHRDIKLENFLFETEASNAQLKLIDFGFSQHFDPKEILHRDVGSPFYVAPEVLEKNYTEKCDVWSIGVVTYILLCGEPPFNGANNGEILHAVKHGKPSFRSSVFQHVSREAIGFIKKCLERNVKDRMSAREAHMHPWFQIIHPSNFPPPQVSSEVIDSMKTFTKRSRLARLCLEVVAHALTGRQIEALRTEFAKFDSNNTGQIQYSELRQILETMSDFSAQEIEELFEGMSVEHDGVIHYHEFIAAAINQKEITENNMKLAFDKLSHHHDYISVEDIQDLLGMDATVEDVQQMLTEAGIPSSSRLSYDDFKQIMRGGTPSHKRPVKDAPYKIHSHKIRFFHTSSSADGSNGGLRPNESTNSLFGTRSPNTSLHGYTKTASTSRKTDE